MSCWRVSDLKLLLRKTSCVTAGALDPHSWDALRVTHLEIRREHTPPERLHTLLMQGILWPSECDIIAWYDLMVFVHAVLKRRSCCWFRTTKFSTSLPIQSERGYWRVFTLTQLVDSQWWPYLTLQDSWHHDETWCGWLCLHNRFTVQEFTSSITQQLDTVDEFN